MSEPLACVLHATDFLRRAHARYALGSVYLQLRLYEEAIAEINKAITFSGREATSSPELGYAYALAGRGDAARLVLAALEERSGHGYVDPHHVALIHIGLDDKDKAFSWLDRAYREHSRELMMLKVNPVCDPLRSDARFIELINRVGLEKWTVALNARCSSGSGSVSGGPKPIRRPCSSRSRGRRTRLCGSFRFQRRQAAA
jgi:tetratricopeptide (TPR) repeat protein